MQDHRKLIEPRSADPVCTVLVFLELLKRQPDDLADSFLRKTKKNSTEPNLRANGCVDGFELPVRQSSQGMGTLIRRRARS